MLKMTKRQKRYAQYKTYPHGWYHLVTDKTKWLFHTPEEFVFGMNTIALCALLYPVRIVRFELMGNQYPYRPGRHGRRVFESVLLHPEASWRRPGLPTDSH